MNTLLLLLLSLPGFASAPQGIYFGGFRATQSQVNCMLGGGVVKAYPYPEGAGASALSAQEKGVYYIREVINLIDNSPADARFIVAGHSSGAALSNRVAQLVRDPQKVKLVSLDGFSPPADARNRVSDFACWYAKNGNVSSKNAASMRANCGSRARRFDDNHCLTGWCLHFVLANKNAPADLSPGTFAAQGYANCNPNRDWMR